MRISIITPSFNQGIYLNQCIASVLRQSVDDLEYFLYDGGSIDLSAKIIDSYKDVFFSEIEKDFGHAHAVNKGLRRAKGDVLGFLNSDDVLLPGALDKVRTYFNENPDVDLVFGRAHYIDESGNCLGDYLVREWDFERFKEECFICQPAAFWTRRIMDRIGYFDEERKFSLDYDYWIRIVQAGGQVGFLDDYLASSRTYPETKTRANRGLVYWDNFRLLRKRLGYVPAHWIEGYMNLLKIEKRHFLSWLVPARGKFRSAISKFIQLWSSIGSSACKPNESFQHGRRRRKL